MNILSALIVALVLLPTSVGADESPAESNENSPRSEETLPGPAEEPAGRTEPAAERTESPTNETPATPAGEPDTTDDEPTGANESPAGDEEGAAGPTPEPTGARPDFAAIQQYLVVVKDGLENASQSPGFSVSDQGHIVTAAGTLRDRQSYLVSTAAGQVFSASKIKADEQTGLWILQLSDSGHGLAGLPFARTALQAAAPLYAVTFNPSGSDRFTSVAGAVTQLINTDRGQMIQHNALFSLASAGTPLLNRCYQAVGVNVLEKRGFLRREIDPTQEGSAQSLAATLLASLLAPLNLSLPVADTECLSLEEETQQQLERARQEQEAALQREQEAAALQAQAAAQEAQRKEEELRREKDAAEARARQAAAEKQRLEQEAQRQLEQTRQEQQTELERQQDEAQRREAALQQEKEAAEQQAAHRQRQMLLYGSIIGGLVLLGVLLLIRRKQKRLQTTEQERQNIAGALDRAQAGLSQAAEQDRLRSSAPDVFLEGETPPIVLKIPGASLVEQNGAVVGRSPAASTFVINHEQISRQHFRLSLRGQQVMLEDLGSTNGTSIDGVAVETGRPTPVRDGGRLGLGDLELTLHIGR